MFREKCVGDDSIGGAFTRADWIVGAGGRVSPRAAHRHQGDDACHQQPTRYFHDRMRCKANAAAASIPGKKRIRWKLKCAG